MRGLLLGYIVHYIISRLTFITYPNTQILKTKTEKLGKFGFWLNIFIKYIIRSVSKSKERAFTKTVASVEAQKTRT